MKSFSFITEAGIWQGKGDIQIPATNQLLSFETKWIVTANEKGCVKARQQIFLQNIVEPRLNDFSFIFLTDVDFEVLLNNEVMKNMKGKGQITSKGIEWMFKDESSVFGQESYILMDSTNYNFTARYGDEIFYTTIQGCLYKLEK